MAASIPGYKKLSSLALEPAEAITLRARRVIHFKYHFSVDVAQPDDLFATLRRIVEEIGKATASEAEMEATLVTLAGLFASPHTSLSSFELLQSGLVDGLLRLMTDEGRTGKSH